MVTKTPTKYEGYKCEDGTSMLAMEDFIAAVRGEKLLPTDEYGTLQELISKPVEIAGLGTNKYYFAGLTPYAGTAKFVPISGGLTYNYSLGLRLAGKEYGKPTAFKRGECVRSADSGLWAANLKCDVGFKGTGSFNSLNSDKFRGYVRNPVPDANGLIEVYAVCYIKPGLLESTGKMKAKGKLPK